MFTDGDPQANQSNQMAGFDFQYRNTRLSGGRTLQAEAWYQQTDTEGKIGDDGAYGIGIRMPNSSGLRWGIETREFEQNFDPAMGFVNRTGVHTDAFNIGYTKRPSGGYLRSIFGGLDVARTEHLDGGLDSQQISARLIELENQSADSLSVRLARSKDVLQTPFEISPGIVIPVGAYAYDWGIVQLQTGNQRSLYGGLTVGQGGFLGGTRLTQRSSLGWRRSRYFSMQVSYGVDEIDLPAGKFTTRISSFRFDTVMSAKISWVNLLQYDNRSEVASLNSRLHWTPEAGRNVYVVFNHNLEDLDRDNRFHSERSDWTLKADYTFRF